MITLFLLIKRFLKEYRNSFINNKNIKIKIFYFFKFIYHNYYFQDNPLSLKLPWITYAAYDFLINKINKSFVVFEYGTGGSTLFFLSKVSELVSVEHDETWFQFVKERLNKIQFNGLHEFHLVVPTLQINNEIEMKSYQMKEYKHFDFKDYVSIIDNYSSEYFDLILIDGRARPYCFYRCLSKVKPGGYIVLDNSERKHYQDVLNQHKDWIVFDFFSPTIASLRFTKTTIFQKPLLN
ncbi:hypothetical protein [Algoriphagus sp. CAU 1675]|uniref:hypothetical protein n=1 Tax=Algoriphagus sp. CAU 1675 TaxID=3032597 RepID=UPI0023DC60D5|nr:hypothetical protein [Algoriphagus sp. CAU 1675]MDF2159404.1 hypothetical protein [Algoriphagus sp. CAU 1675]